jgi:outer membrane protein
MKMIIRETAISACLALLALSAAAFPDSTAITLDSFLKMALENNPETKISAAQEASGSASLQSARSALLPRVGLSAQATRNQSVDSFPAMSEPRDQLSAGVSGSLLLYDFGRTGSKIRQAGHALTATRESGRLARQEVVLTAKTAYFNALLAGKMLDVARESVRQSEEHLLQARTLFEIGKQAKYAVTKAEVDVANARVALIKAQSGIKAAKVKMESAAGVDLPEGMIFSDSLEQNESAIALEGAFASADSLRPDLRAAAARLEMARTQVRGARADYLPELNASAGYGYRSPDATDWTGSWNAGVSLSQPLYQGGAIRAKVLMAEASFAEAEATFVRTRQVAHAGIQQYLLDKQDAMERVAAAVKYIAEASEGLSMSQERYRAGAATFIEVTDAEVALVNARITHAQALYDYRVAHARLLGATGMDK